MMKSQDIPLIGPIMTKFIGTRNERFVKRYTTRVEAITALEPDIRKLTDTQLRAKSDEFRERLERGDKAAELLIEAFAVAREAMDRGVGIREVFNPKRSFDPSVLPSDMRKLYEQTKAAMDAIEPQPTEGLLLGCTEPVPGWRTVDIPPEVYQAVREAYPDSRPPYRARPFDVQLIGGMVLYEGKISEMKTGEGKTIVAPLSCYLAALEGLQCHVVTVNNYLVQRDRDWTFPFFHALGLTVGAIRPIHEQPEAVKQQMYYCDVVYGTSSEFGFDYLRDNMKRSVADQVQKHRDFCIVDEVDSILIDEARTPLIISGAAHEDAPRYALADEIAQQLVERQKDWTKKDKAVEECKRRIKGLEGDIRNARDKSDIPALKAELEKAEAELPRLEAIRDEHTQFFEVEMERKQATLTNEGIARAQEAADVGSFYVGENIDIPHLLEQSLRAHVVYQRDRDYVVQDIGNGPEVVIVDAFTGRLMVGRQWSDGLHQAIECKEGVKIKEETQTLATITVQNYFKQYRRLAGMTGTADTEAQEFHDIYHLDVVSIPTNMPLIRGDHNDLVYLGEKDKWEAIADEIKRFQEVGQPVLVGTTSVDRSERLSQRLSRKSPVRHEILNAKNHEREASIIANAGLLGSVTVSTNMAGRGTDIMLAKITPEDLIEHWKRTAICPKDITADMSEERILAAVYRKIASNQLGLRQSQVKAMSDDEISRALLESWAERYTWLDTKKIPGLSDEGLRTELDATGQCKLHRLRLWSNVEQMGGLHVIGTERHESRRIDNQLRGRSGRQGDDGSSRFFISLEDDLMKMFAGEITMKVLAKLGMKEGDAIEHPMLSKSVERAQRKVEERNFMIRKNVLEYDEVMEYQRGFFYGLRQDILEGRNVKDTIFQYIDEAVDDKVAECLSKDYVPTCIGEWAVDKLSWAVEIERLRGKDAEDVGRWLKQEAKAEARHTVDVTLGEYMPYGVDPVDWNLKGLAEWAKGRFNVEMKPHVVREMDQTEVMRKLNDAAFEAIDRTDLEDVDQFLVKHYGEQQVCKWVKSKFEFGVDPEALAKCEIDEERIDLIVTQARDKYNIREATYPAEYIMDMTMALMRQDPGRAATNLVEWSNWKFNLGWDEKIIRTKMPQQIRDEIVKAGEAMFKQDGLDKEVADAVALNDPGQLRDHLKMRFGLEITDDDLALEGEERAAKIREIIEGFVRSEITQFEQYVLIEILDVTWKDHLYAMDQLRETISYRAFSQQDPRIEYKREGARYFEQMKQAIRDRVTDIIFKAKLQPRAAQPPAAMGAPGRVPGAMPAGQPGRGDGLLDGPTPGTGIVGAGFTAPAAGTVPPDTVEAAAKPKHRRPKGKKRRH
ncbi:MAG: preprotein translocase subunit SecA [Phycisphaerales bacterium]|nr:preprotein translocase subunit SecA [Phycisphaerales bacterium]